MSDAQAERINRLEEALAHHEALVSDLNDELTKQWQTIERISRRIQDLEEKMDAVRPVTDVPASGEPPPPHY